MKQLFYALIALIFAAGVSAQAAPAKTGKAA
jgi:hypothetical protein